MSMSWTWNLHLSNSSKVFESIIPTFNTKIMYPLLQLFYVSHKSSYLPSPMTVEYPRYLYGASTFGQNVNIRLNLLYLLSTWIRFKSVPVRFGCSVIPNSIANIVCLPNVSMGKFYARIHSLVQEYYSLTFYVWKLVIDHLYLLL